MGNGLIIGLLLTTLSSLFTVIGAAAGYEKGKFRWTIWGPMIATVLSASFTTWQLLEDQKRDSTMLGDLSTTLSHVQGVLSKSNEIIERLHVADSLAVIRKRDQDSIDDFTCKSIALSIAKLDEQTLRMEGLAGEMRSLHTSVKSSATDLHNLYDDFARVGDSMAVVVTTVSGTAEHVTEMVDLVEQMTFPMHNIIARVLLAVPNPVELTGNDYRHPYGPVHESMPVLADGGTEGENLPCPKSHWYDIDRDKAYSWFESRTSNKLWDYVTQFSSRIEFRDYENKGHNALVVEAEDRMRGWIPSYVGFNCDTMFIGYAYAARFVAFGTLDSAAERSCRVLEGLQPEIIVHGHMEIVDYAEGDSIFTASGTRVIPRFFSIELRTGYALEFEDLEEESFSRWTDYYIDDIRDFIRHRTRLSFIKQ